MPDESPEPSIGEQFRHMVEEEQKAAEQPCQCLFCQMQQQAQAAIAAEQEAARLKIRTARRVWGLFLATDLALAAGAVAMAFGLVPWLSPSPLAWGLCGWLVAHLFNRVLQYPAE